MAASLRPKESLVRAILPGLEFREATGDRKPQLAGHFSVFNEWTTIRSSWEGTFREMVAPGAFTKTFAENGKNIKVLFQHGRDGMLGDKPIGNIVDLREDETGAWYVVDLYQGLPDLLLEGLRNGVYGASFRFSVKQEDFNDRPKRSAENPEGLPERVIKEAAVSEFGPVTWGAYPTASADLRAGDEQMCVRSMTDDFQFLGITAQPELLKQLVDGLAQSKNPQPQSRTHIVRSPNAKIVITNRGQLIEENLDEERAPWDSSYISDLPDSAFLYIEPGGKKDDDGKTTPRSLRHFPYRDSSGSVDLPHLRNALARIPQSNLSPAVKAAATAKAQRLLANENKSNSAGQFGEERVDSEDLSILGQMLDLANCYLEEQDEPDDQKNVAPMEAIVKAIAALVPVEADEDEPADEPDDEENSAVINAEERLEPDSSESTTPKPESEPSGATTRSGLILPHNTGPVTTKSGLILP